MSSRTSAFQSAIDRRDGPHCILCGSSLCLAYVHTRPDVDDNSLWDFYKQHNYIPATFAPAAYEPRNGIRLCPNHRHAFVRGLLYFRWVPECRAFVAVNHAGFGSLEEFHGQTLRLDHTAPECPLPVLFWLHELVARAGFPFGKYVRSLCRAEIAPVRCDEGGCGGVYGGGKGERADTAPCLAGPGGEECLKDEEFAGHTNERPLAVREVEDGDTTIVFSPLNDDSFTLQKAREQGFIFPEERSEENVQSTEGEDTYDVKQWGGADDGEMVSNTQDGVCKCPVGKCWWW